MKGRLALFANTDWYLYNFRLSLAEAARDAGWEVLLLSPAGDYVQEIHSAGFTWREIAIERRSLGPFQQLKAIRQVRRALVEHQIDILHSFTLKCAILGSLAARTTRRTRTVNAITGLGYLFSNPDRKAKVIRTFAMAAMRLALPRKRTWTIFQNPDDQAFFLEHKLCAPDATCVIPGSGVDCDRFRPPTQERNDGKIRVLFVGRLLRDKGIYELLEAAGTVRAQAAQVEFWIAGTPDHGNPASVPKYQIDKWRTKDLATFLGHVDHMPDLYASVDIVVLPSYREGLPRSLIEAAASARAIITTDVPGCRDVVAHNKTGLLVPAKESTQLALALLKLSRNRLGRTELGASARAHAESQFSVQKISEATLCSYRRVLPDDDLHN